MITLLMIFLLADFRLGLWSMIPNFLPVLVGLGVMGMLDLPLDAMSILVGSIAIGLAVDDTVHFMHNFRRNQHNSSGCTGGCGKNTNFNWTGHASYHHRSFRWFFHLHYFVYEQPYFFWSDYRFDHYHRVVWRYPACPSNDGFDLQKSAFQLNKQGNTMMFFKIISNTISITIFSILISGTIMFPEKVFALNGREIMEKVNARDTGDRSITEMEMILIDKKGKKRVRKLKTYSLEQGKHSKSLMFFISPADVKNTGFLTYDYDESGKDDDQWLFLPALKKTKRIASGDKSGSFMGSDLNYSDMTSPDLDLYDYTLMKETEVKGQKVWQIKAVPKTKDEAKKSGYSKSVVFIRQDNYVMIRGVRWIHKKKRNKYLDVRKLEKIDGIWVSTEMHVTTKSGKKTLHKTIMKQKNIHFNHDEVIEKLFTIRRLEKGL